MNRFNKITVLVAEDHDIVREGLEALLETEGDFEVVAQAKTGREAVAQTREFHPQVILMDIDMPGLNGVEATRQIMTGDPKARILILSSHAQSEYIENALAAGAIGFLDKQISAETLAKAVREIEEGRAYFSPSIASRMRDDMNRRRARDGGVKSKGAGLTAREREVLQLIAEGSLNKQVAAELEISIKTVEKHRQNMMDKLNIHGIAGLTHYAIAHGVVASMVPDDCMGASV
jgi:DNA-binding NarL/FixJ family response regulator